MNRTAARARARDVDALVVEIAQLIAAKKWVAGETAKELAAREGVKPATVEEWAAEAGRFLRVGQDIEKRRALNLRRLDETYTASREPKDRVSAVAEQNKMLGLHAPTKVDVRVEQYEQLAPPALHAKLIEQRRKLTESIDALEREHPELVSPGVNVVTSIDEEKACVSCGLFGGHRFECPGLHKPEEKC